MFVRRRHGRCLILLLYDTLTTTFSPGMILLFYSISSRVDEVEIEEEYQLQLMLCLPRTVQQGDKGWCP